MLYRLAMRSIQAGAGINIGNDANAVPGLART